jgi:hypothetical protein
MTMIEQTSEKQGLRELTIDETAVVGGGASIWDVIVGLVVAGATYVAGKVIDLVCHTKH